MKIKMPKYGLNRRRRILSKGFATKNVNTYRRFQAMAMLTGGLKVMEVHRILDMARSTIYGVIYRFFNGGLDALHDRRRENGHAKVDLRFYDRLTMMVASDPGRYGWSRFTWTRELLVRTMEEKYHTKVSIATMGKALADIGARLGSPRPVVICPWTELRRTRRINQIKRLVENLPTNEVVYYQDEVDIHLNPKIGPDWMLPNQQKIVITPGKNQKRYIAGAYNPKNQKMLWVEGKSKNSNLFCDNIDLVMKKNRKAKRVHVILDNYIIHKSKITQKRLAIYGERLVLHFLPPYCPNENLIERKWRDLHAAVTRNHKCKTIKALMVNVRTHLVAVGTKSLLLKKKNKIKKVA